MDAARPAGAQPSSGRFDELHAEAKAALAQSANAIRSTRERYRQAYAEDQAHWLALRDVLSALERRAGIGPIGRRPAEEASAADRRADDGRLASLRRQVELAGSDLGRRKTELARFELAARHLESTWLFLERGDGTLVGDPLAPSSQTDVEMRIVEAQEAERSRLAQEIHDGPAQGLSNAIFQVEYLERVLDRDLDLARTELRYLRELLRRELGDVRSFISQLRPPLLDELGLDGALRDAAEHASTNAGIPVTTDLRAAVDGLGEAQQTVALRVAQEALQNVRKHASASTASIATRLEDGSWILEVRDDGTGFDIGTVAARGRRNFGLQFMRERADLIGAAFEVRSRPDGGTVVRLAIPTGAEESR